MTLLTELDLPVLGAPMAGGVSSPLLVAAVCDAGGLGMLPAGYRTPEQLAADLVHVRDLTDRPFGVNLFVPQPIDRGAHEQAVDAYREALLQVVNAKLEGVPVPEGEDEQAPGGDVIDLMAALKASVAAIEERRKAKAAS